MRGVGSLYQPRAKKPRSLLMPASLVLGALVCSFLVRQGVAQPRCYYDEKPPDPDQVLVFCPEQVDGSCCNDLEEVISITWYQDAFPEGSNPTEECMSYYRQVVCGPCNSYSAQLYDVLGSELGPKDGMTMKHDFCQHLVEACDGHIDFPSYDGESYCEKHTLGSTGSSTDAFWSYPPSWDFTLEISTAFPSLPDSDLPSDLISMHMTPDGDEWWLAGQDGQIVKLSSAVDPTSSTTVLDLSSGAELYVAFEEGLLDFAFSPAFNSNSYFYVSYTILDSEGPKNRLSRFTYSSTPAATLASIDIILTSELKATSIHSAGWVGFKPSDYADPSESSHDIYWATGDGGPQTDPYGIGQDTSNLLGAIIRVSVPSGTSAADMGYTIPSGNYPGGRGEICAPGFRNPFRCGFDSETDDLFCGDLGHTMIEEINIVVCGNNYGWSRFEGSRCQEAAEGVYGDCEGASRSEFTFPIYESCHATYDSTDAGEDEFTAGIDICGTRSVTAQSIIGGYVYRGQQFREVLGGAYLFADVMRNNIYFLTQKEGEWVPGIVVGDGSASVISFAEDNNGEIYVITEESVRNAYHLPCGELCSTTCVEQVDVVPAYESLGCFGDDTSNRALSLVQAPTCPNGEKAMSPVICASYCATIPGAVYFGLEYRSQCFCGGENEDFAKHGSLDDLSCDYLCVGSSDHFCGGDRAIEVFEFSPSPLPLWPTPAPSTVPYPTPPPFDEYLGCFGDVNYDRALTGDSTSSSAMTNQVCASFCEGTEYYGTQFGRECFCSAPGDYYDKHGPATCNSLCSGDSTQVCGGANALSVFAHAVATPEPTPSPSSMDENFLGCFGDNNRARALTGRNTKSTTSMTTHFCASFCDGSDYFGTQFSTECFCSAEGDDYDVYGPATCDYTCSGDIEETCGGKNALSVYEHGGSGPSPSPEPMPTPPPVDDSGIIYVGCFGDNNQDRALTGRDTSSSSMTAEFCASFCEGSDYFGTEYSKECFCSAAGDDIDTHGTATCDYPCTGDDEEICGGKNAISVYTYSDSPVPTPAPMPVTDPTPAPTLMPGRYSGYTYLGCFGDSSQYRVLTGSGTSSSSMTADACATFCEGSQYFGTEFSKECFCSTTGDDYDALGAATCDYPCTGDSGEICGGKNAISVYEVS